MQGPDGWAIDDVKRAVSEVLANWQLQVAVAGAVLSMAFYNFFGVSVTKRLSSTARLSIDACRTVVVWVLSMLAGWERFIGMQLLGYIILVCGTTLYNELLSVVIPPDAGCALAAIHASVCKAPLAYKLTMLPWVMALLE